MSRRRAGYANGWADAMEQVSAWADEWESSYGGVNPLPERWGIKQRINSLRDLIAGREQEA